MEIYTPENTASLDRAILWQYEKAERLKSLIGAQQTFFDSAVTDFWNSYRDDTFNLDTANAFGLRVWGSILGVDRPNYDSYVPVTVSSDAVPVGLQPSTTWTWTRTTANGERVYYDPTETWAYWYSTTKGWIFSIVLDVGNEGVIDYFVSHDYPDTITVSGTGTLADTAYPFLQLDTGGYPQYNKPGSGQIIFENFPSVGWDLLSAEAGFEEWRSNNFDPLPPKIWTNIGDKGSPAPILTYTVPIDQYIGQGAFSGTITLSSDTENIPFSDEMYRALLRARLMLMRMTATIPNINRYMEFLFPNNSAAVTDGLNMTISYRFIKELTEEEAAVLSVDGVLPRPAGVKATLFGSEEETQFGFEGQYRLAADSSTQLRNFDSASFAAE